MLYDCSNRLEADKLKKRIDGAISRGEVIEVTSPFRKRSLDQNSYLHLIIAYLASQIGESPEYVKREYYKKECNGELYIVRKRDCYTERVTEEIRSSKDLSVEEMSLSIERFKDWSARVVEIPLPDAEKKEELTYALQEIERNNKYV